MKDLRHSRSRVDLRVSDTSRRAADLMWSHLGATRIAQLPDKGLVDLEINPMDYSDPLEFRRDYQAVSLMSKFPKLKLGLDTKAIAFDKFREAEHVCASTNDRVFWTSPIWGVDAAILLARRKIMSVLGVCRFEEVLSHSRFSGGASTRLPRDVARVCYKFHPNKRGKPHVTESCYPAAVEAVKSSPSWTEMMVYYHGYDTNNWFKTVAGNKILTVPKNAKTERTIAKEPDMNMYLQLGLGGVIRKRLKKVGVDLDTQSKNQHLAMLGSLNDDLATIDLSAASDSIAWELVKLLLPREWVAALQLTRSHVGSMPDGTVIRYQKVSSMGNGFTFELESLIFWALSSSCLDILDCPDRRLAVYGDDIIIHRDVVPLVLDVFSFCGFTINEEKSFTKGPFRESCGKHYFRGVDVTPIYLRKPIDSVFRLYWLVNSFRRWSSQTSGYPNIEDFPLWKRLCSLIPKEFRDFSVPEGYGDFGVVRSLSEVPQGTITVNSNYSRRFKVIAPRSIYKRPKSHSDYWALFLEAISSQIEREMSPLEELGKLLHTKDTARSPQGVIASAQEANVGSRVDLYFGRIRGRSTTVWNDPHPWV